MQKNIVFRVLQRNIVNPRIPPSFLSDNFMRDHLGLFHNKRLGSPGLLSDDFLLFLSCREFKQCVS